MKFGSPIENPVSRVECDLDVLCTYAWKPWFAWRPVHIVSGWVWLERIERRRLFKYCKIVPMAAGWYEYRAAP